MKKVIVFIFYIALFIGSIFSTSSYTIKGKINASYSQFINDPDYNIILSSLEDNGITEINGSVYVKQGIEIKIEYKNAALVGGGPTGSVNIKTKVQKDNIDILNESIFIIQEGETSEIKIIQTGSSESVLHSIKLIGVKEILSNGELLYIKDINKIIKASGDTYRFELSGTEILLINKNNKNWWVNEDSILNIIELKGSGSGNGSGGGSQDENGNYVGHTYYTFESYSPKIEGGYENFQNQLKVKSDIKLIIEHRTGGSGQPDSISSSVVLNIYVDKENPTASKTIKDECEKINNVWKNEDIIIILKESEDDCGIEFYEYSIDGREWVKAKEFTTEDQIVFDETVYFRAVDFFGKKSPIQECKVRVDKSKPEIISSDGQNEDSTNIKNWTNEDVEVTATDTGSGIKNFKIDEQEENNKRSI
ncbi:MAG: hypothetical protein K5829_13485, partial [Treponema sp.]|nr:hypothetical protein [Treponema sp.]